MIRVIFFIPFLISILLFVYVNQIKASMERILFAKHQGHLKTLKMEATKGFSIFQYFFSVMEENMTVQVNGKSVSYASIFHDKSFFQELGDEELLALGEQLDKWNGYFKMSILPAIMMLVFLVLEVTTS